MSNTLADLVLDWKSSRIELDIYRSQYTVIDRVFINIFGKNLTFLDSLNTELGSSIKNIRNRADANDALDISKVLDQTYWKLITHNSLVISLCRHRLFREAASIPLDSFNSQYEYELHNSLQELVNSLREINIELKAKECGNSTCDNYATLEKNLKIAIAKYCYFLTLDYIFVYYKNDDDGLLYGKFLQYRPNKNKRDEYLKLIKKFDTFEKYEESGFLSIRHLFKYINNYSIYNESSTDTETITEIYKNIVTEEDKYLDPDVQYIAHIYWEMQAHVRNCLQINQVTKENRNDLEEKIIHAMYELSMVVLSSTKLNPSSYSFKSFFNKNSVWEKISKKLDAITKLIISESKDDISLYPQNDLPDIETKLAGLKEDTNNKDGQFISGGVKFPAKNEIIEYYSEIKNSSVEEKDLKFSEHFNKPKWNMKFLNLCLSILAKEFAYSLSSKNSLEQDFVIGAGASGMFLAQTVQKLMAENSNYPVWNFHMFPTVAITPFWQPTSGSKESKERRAKIKKIHIFDGLVKTFLTSSCICNILKRLEIDNVEIHIYSLYSDHKISKIINSDYKVHSIFDSIKWNTKTAMQSKKSKLVEYSSSYAVDNKFKEYLPAEPVTISYCRQQRPERPDSLNTDATIYLQNSDHFWSLANGFAETIIAEAEKVKTEQKLDKKPVIHLYSGSSEVMSLAIAVAWKLKQEYTDITINVHSDYYNSEVEKTKEAIGFWFDLDSNTGLTKLEFFRREFLERRSKQIASNETKEELEEKRREINSKFKNLFIYENKFAK